MEDLQGRVAVVTGGASGIGRALVDAFVEEGMKVVVADVEEAALASALEELTATGADVSGEHTDVSKPDSVDALADVVYERHGACHVLCNNAGVGVPAAKPWEATVNDWRWAMGVNVMGVVHGTQAFVPRMLASGEPGHVVNTSSPDGGIAPMPQASVYAASKAAVSTFTECLAAQLAEEGGGVQASVFYPSGGLMRTGLWSTERNRPPELARERPRESEPMTIERLEEMAAASGREVRWQPLDELARLVVDGIRTGRFVMTLDAQTSAATLHGRADRIGRGELPSALHHELLG